MENFNLNKEKTIDPDINRVFFSEENIKKLIGDGAMAAGTLFALAGIAEFITGEKIGNYLEHYKDQIPGIINWVIAHLDSMSVIFKAAGGSSLITAGSLIRNISPAKEKHE